MEGSKSSKGSCSNVEEQEFMEIAKLLPSLAEERFLTEFECLQITSTSTLSDRRLAVYGIMMSKTEREMCYIGEKFRRMACKIKAGNKNGGLKEESVTSTREDPMGMNYYVIKHLFKFIPVNDLKNCCLVSRTWDSVLLPFLRSRSTIHLQPRSFSFQLNQVSAFLATFEPSLQPEFTTFKLTCFGLAWIPTELDGLFEKWGKNIRKLVLDDIALKNKNDDGRILRTYNISNWISVLSNLKELNIICGRFSNQLEVDLNCLKSVRSICLNNSVIIVPSKDLREIVPITPSTIQLKNVKFNSEENQTVNKFCLKDFINLSTASKLILRDMGKLDLGSLELNIRCLHLIDTQIENWTSWKGTVDFLYLTGDYFTLERNELEIKQLLLSLYTEIDLSVLPASVEKIHFSEIRKIVRNQNDLQFPKLNFLGFTAFRCYHNLRVMADFANCANLVEIELIGHLKFWTLNVDWVPKTVKRMKLSYIEPLVVCGGTILELDTLILKDHFEEHPGKFYDKLMDLIDPKVLVVSLGQIKFEAIYIINFVLKNTHFEKIVVGSVRFGWEEVEFEKSVLSHFVDKRAHCYEFKNGRGISISRADFDKWTKMNQLNEDFCPENY